MPSPSFDNRPPIQSCDECGGDYFTASSQMWKLCPECAHYLYGYPLCEHVFVGSQCSKCGWSGTRSKYILERIEANGKRQRRDIDAIIEKVLVRLAAVAVRQHTKFHPADDDGIWWFSLPGLEREVHVESSSANCPFLIETDEQSSGEALRATSVDQSVQLIVEYLTAASKHSDPIFLSAERYWP